MAASAVDLPFAIDEYADRLDRLRQQMHARTVDVLLLDELEDLAYVTGYAPRGTRYQVCVVPLERDPIMLIRSVDETTFREQSWLADSVSMGDAEDPVAVLERVLHQRGWDAARIGAQLDSHFLPVRRYEAIKAVLPAASFQDFSDVLSELRLRKSAKEIAYLRRAAEIADTTMIRASEVIRAGVNERTAVVAAYATALSMGADNSWVGVITSAGRTTSVHGNLGDHRVEAGEVVHMEMIPQVADYTARIMRPTIVAPVSEELIAACERIVQIQDAQLAAMRPGALASDVDRVARDGVLQAGLRSSFDNITGYTVGFIPGIATPRTSDFTRVFLPTSDWILEEGMTFHMYIMARGVGFSETVLVTPGGCELLTHLPRAPFVR